MYKKILVPLDGSPMAEQVLPHVQMLAERFGGQVVLIQVLSEPTFDALFTGPKLAAIAHENAISNRCKSNVYLDRISAQLQNAAVQATTCVLEGPVAETILACAEQLNADLIAICTHGHGGWVSRMRGSVTYELLHDVKIPVLMIAAQLEQKTTPVEPVATLSSIVRY